MGPADAIRDLVEPPLVDAGLELWDVEIASSVVRVLVERAGGIDLDGLAAATAAVSPLLDDHPELTPPGRYELEVSSPGIERTLRTVDHHRRHLGALVAVKTSEAVAGSRRLRGTLTAVDDETITLALEGTPRSEPVVVPHHLIQRTRTVVVWGPAPKPGTRPAAPAPMTPETEDASS
jgi:ribosome maturation factor RimP